jgi:hypothetical protein
VALKRGYAPVALDELAWQEDLRIASRSARRIASETRARLEREGQSIDALFACDADARDGTSLPGCVKVYLPPPGGPLGLVYRLARNKQGRLYLDHLAFGIRHQPDRKATTPTVYEIAHRRLHGQRS